MLLPLLACVPLLTQAAPAPTNPDATAPAAPTSDYVGAAFSLTAGEDLEVSETGNGNVHFLEVRRAGRPEDELEPLVKLLIVPDAAREVDTQGFLELLGAELIQRRGEAGLTLTTTEDVTRLIGQVNRLGKRVIFQDTAPVESFDLFTFASETHLVGMLIKVPGAATTRVEALLAELLPTVAVRPIEPTTTRVESIGAFRVDVPLLAQEARPPSELISVLQIGLPGGMVELVHQELSAPWEASLAVASYRDQRREIVREVAAGRGVEATRPTWTGVWVGDGLLTGERMDLPLEEGGVREVLSFTTAAEQHLFGASYETMPEGREVLHQAARAVLASVRTFGTERPVALDLGNRVMRQDLGLTWVYPDKLTIEKRHPADPGQPTRLLLTSAASDAPGRDVLNQYFVDVHAAPLALPTPTDPLAALRAELEQLVREAYPAAELGESFEIASNLLGERRGGLTQHFVQAGVPMQLTGLFAPHRGGEVVAGCMSPAADQGAALWTFSNLLARLSVLPDGPRAITTPDWALTFDPADWILASALNSSYHQLELERRDGTAEVRVQTVGWSGLADERSFEDLQRRAEADFAAAREDPAGLLALDPGTEVALEELLDAVPLGGTLALRDRMLLRAAGHPGLVLDLWTLRTATREVTLETRAAIGDTAASAAIAELLESLVLAAPLRFPGTPAFAAGLGIELPAGTWATAYTRGPSTYLDISSRYVEKESLVVRTETVGPAADLAAIEVQAREALEFMATMMSPDSEPGEEQTLTATFAGEEVPRWRRVTLGPDGREVSAIDVLLLVRDGVVHEVSLFSDRTQGGDAWRTFEAVLGRAVLLPGVEHFAADGFALEVDSGRYTVRRVAGTEQVTFEVTGEGGSLRVADTGGGDWAAEGDDGPLPEVLPQLSSVSEVGPTRSVELPLEHLRLSLQVPASAEVETLENVTIASSQEQHATSVVRLRTLAQEDGLNALVLLDLMQAEDCEGAQILERLFVRRTLLGKPVEGRRLRLRQPDGEETLLDLYAVDVDGVSVTVEATRWPAEDADHVGGLPAIDLALDTLAVAPQ
ncbi:MAG: hypothetical protein P1V81_13300 [Planctomycetota bacterium]|nr:hypothetical protein [Planctomycetota bacterium]